MIYLIGILARAKKKKRKERIRRKAGDVGIIKASEEEEDPNLLVSKGWRAVAGGLKVMKRQKNAFVAVTNDE